MGTEAGLLRGLACALTLAACGEPAPEGKLVGWPPSEPVVPVRDVVEPPDTAPDVVEVAAPDTAPAPDVPPPLLPCAELVEIACDLWTPYADACREARKAMPDDSHGPTREACQALVDRYKKDELPRIGNPCGRLARAICKEAGELTERCKAARARTPLLTERREHRACLGDLLWFEAKTLRR